MYIIHIGWLYVALMMSIAEAASTNGSILGALITFVFYGLLPVGLLFYFMGTPARRRALRAKEQASNQPNTGGEPTTDAVTPMGKKT
jgi:hypothetical protein